MGIFHRVLIMGLSVGVILSSVNLFQPSVSQADVQFGGIKKILKAVFPPCGLRTKKERFVVKGETVCDNATGLRWQRTPGVAGPIASPCDDGEECSWQQAIDYCTNLASSGKKKRKPWRLAEVKELISLLDYSVEPPASFIPPGSSFIDVGLAIYWSATEVAGFSAFAYHVGFGDGMVDSLEKDEAIFRAWCVRGGKDTRW